MTHFQDFDARKPNAVEWARNHEHDPDPVVKQAARRILRRHYLVPRPCARSTS